jgi:hypothetical protein
MGILTSYEEEWVYKLETVPILSDEEENKSVEGALYKPRPHPRDAADGRLSIN